MCKRHVPLFLYWVENRNMNRRLNCILSHIPVRLGVIDVGTDHGYLPAELALRGYSGNLIASDLRPEPLAAAKRTAENNGVKDRIRFLLCDGLDDCDPDAVDTIVIAGMGGDTICGILDRAEWCMDRRYTLVLQPMTHAEVLRYWLVNNEFAIVSEDIVEDSGFLYSILTARFGGQTRLSEAELYTGAASLLRDHPLFPSFISRQQGRLETMLRGQEAAMCSDPGRKELLETLIRQMKEMTMYENG